jgi:hypothetical protein
LGELRAMIVKLAILFKHPEVAEENPERPDILLRPNSKAKKNKTRREDSPPYLSTNE